MLRPWASGNKTEPLARRGPGPYCALSRAVHAQSKHAMQFPDKTRYAALACATLAVACGGGGGGGPLEINAPPTSPPPAVSSWSPEGAQICADDFSSFADWDDFTARTTCISNLPELPSRDRMDIDANGLRYHYRALPGRCNDQFVGVPARVRLPADVHEVWLEWTGIFSSNWTNLNAGCPTPGPDFKYVLVWTQKEKVACGERRAEFKIGQGGSENTIHASTVGFSSCDDVPINDDGTTGTVREPGARAYFDGRPHQYRLAFRMLGDGWYEVFAAIDDRVTHQYVAKSLLDDALRWDKIVLGANRNLGAVEDMDLWWKDLKVWAR